MAKFKGRHSDEQDAHSNLHYVITLKQNILFAAWIQVASTFSVVASVFLSSFLHFAKKLAHLTVPQNPGMCNIFQEKNIVFSSPIQCVASGSNSLSSNEDHGEDYISFFPIPSSLANVCICHMLLIAAE